ncbi:hypothetical protein RMSM_04851 [Rhodopirellula maiorica SM1]|uniref:Uncharacterized protein n=1 Tax=Rhodopirellula maiorica SM1 TaxID=1265738 RepID=M5RFH8_9BACT|nr:hypothetical protein RMSM_04851 [Rhodopirellula maiorica SM1]
MSEATRRRSPASDGACDVTSAVALPASASEFCNAFSAPIYQHAFT